MSVHRAKGRVPKTNAAHPKHDPAPQTNDPCVGKIKRASRTTDATTPADDPTTHSKDPLRYASYRTQRSHGPMPEGEQAVSRAMDATCNTIDRMRRSNDPSPRSHGPMPETRE